MPTENGMFVLDTDASVVAISGLLHQEQEWIGRNILRKEIEMLKENDMIGPSKSPLACGVVMAKKKGRELYLVVISAT